MRRRAAALRYSRPIGGFARRLCVGATLLFLAMPAAAQFPSDSEIRAILERRVERAAGVGVVVGLREASGTSRIVFAGSAGDGALPLGPGTVFEIGSITKIFTGTILADMVARGEVSLTDPVRRHLPPNVRVPMRGGAEITLLDLATHRSGLPRLPANLHWSGRTDPYDAYTADQLYAFLSSYQLQREIGEAFEYSNLGVGLLGHVLARAAGLPYEELVRQRITAPIGMASTDVGFSRDKRLSMAQGHDARGTPVPNWNWRRSPFIGAGALRSSVVDMVRFLDANLDEPTTQLEASMREAHRVRREAGIGSPGRDELRQDSIGLTWMIASSGSSSIVWHNGGTAGFASFIGFDPNREIGVVVLSNSSRSVDDIGFHLLDATLPLGPEVAGRLPGWGTILLLLGFCLGVFLLEALAKPANLTALG